MAARTRPVLVFDGDCAFCTRCARALQRIEPEEEIIAWQATNLDELGLTEEQVKAAVQWVSPDGTIRAGHEAIAATLQSAGGIWKPLGRTIVLPGISWLSAQCYRLIAANRRHLPFGP